MPKEKKNKKLNNVDHSQTGSSHITSDKSKSFQQVSFNVLEKAYENDKNGNQIKSKNFKGRAIISSDEMLDTKNNSHNNAIIGKLALIVLFLIVIFAVMAWAGMYLSSLDIFVQTNNSNNLKTAIIKIAKCDKDIIRLNEFLENPINQYTINQFEINNDNLYKVKDELKQLDDEISDVANSIDVQSDDYYYIPFAHQTIESRIMMIDAGIKIYENAKGNVELINKSDSFWSLIIDADALLKESDNLIQSNEFENFEFAKKASENAVSLLNDAILQINDFKLNNNSLDMTIYLRYANARLDSAIISVSACQALIESNIENIAAFNVLYIEKSNIASDIALGMSTTPEQLIRTNYDLNIRPIVEEFKAARQNAAENDFVLRNYIYS